MKRIHYVETNITPDTPTVLVSSTTFDTEKGKVLVYLYQDQAFEIKDSITGDVVASGESSVVSPVYIRRVAKRALQKLTNVFQIETRKKRNV